ncbi:MAG: SMP-30/gluconolactonase/LRE family protein [Rhodospirillales bacterium]|nr:SMP-30/gluconolactonase/LRE family protein [Rhodospirillales bacterium]
MTPRPIPINDLAFIGTGLTRPECVLAVRSGHLCVADFRGGVSIIHPDGRTETVLARNTDFVPKPNGICIQHDGSFLLAHLGAEDGGVYHLHRDGRLHPYLLEIDGEAVPPTNYVHRDGQGRVWVTVSTRLIPRALGYRHDNADGFIILVDDRGARIVADGLGYTNECVVHPDGRQLYVNETFQKRLSKFNIADDGSLSNKSTVADFGAGTFPDGLTFDVEGGVWITSIVSNRVIRIAPDGEQTLILEDHDADHTAQAEAAFQDGTMGRPHLDIASGQRLKNISSLAFGGQDLKTAYLGCLLGDQIATFSSPIAGHPPSHWDVSF